ncbi:MAG: acyl-CoA dehydrogenase family protein [Proteobacteria bacterium]|nr:acyl-CoA dehydrogenase family protein [Pseudomonadota bacterium]MBU4470941.1 acyl-CoA dehydrogenase family protein [Pseudomonadota bacterium]MCG2753823.1 acyl-CoA dehydrogenase family protein [Desulfobacteraceae bacterium]
MDYNFTEEQKALRQELRDFFTAEMKNAPPGISEGESIYDTDEAWAFTRHMAKTLSKKGYLTMAWPKEYGGRDASIIDQMIFSEVIAEYGAPGVDGFGVKMFAPTLMLYANEDQKQRLLVPIGKAEVVYCQGWSEPDAGSDLASVKTLAIKDGDEYVINGQKLWTTGAHRSDRMFLLARTDPESKRNRGLSVFSLSMDTPGVEVRPILFLNQAHIYNEVFLTNVRVPASDRIGPEGDGWRITRSTMNFERSGIGMFIEAKQTLQELVAYMKKTKRSGKYLHEDSALRRKAAKLWAETQAGLSLCYKIAWQQHTGGLDISPHIASESKVFGSEVRQRIYNLGTEILGLFGPLNQSKWSKLDGTMIGGYQNVLIATISMGTSEIQRNIIAWTGAELPRYK